MRYVVTADEMRALDATTIEDLGLPGAVLMENAGRRVAQVILDILDILHGARPGASERYSTTTSAAPARVAVVCGAGNNGGDGYVIARYLRDHGVDATVFLAARADRLRGDARLHHDAYRAMAHPILDISDTSSLGAHAAGIEAADVVVDSVFGTGLTRTITGHYRDVIQVINNNQRGVIVAVDIPSGLCSDTGQVLGIAARAHVTVTMAFLKVGLAVAPGFARAGTVHVAEIGIPASLASVRGVRTVMLEPSDVAVLVPRVDILDHKNRRGHLLAVAGSPGKRGAARLTSWAGLRAGAGLVTLAWPWGDKSEPVAADPVMTAELDPDAAFLELAAEPRPDAAPQPDAEPQPDAADAADAVASRLRALLDGKRALAMGPGMPVGPGGRQLVRSALRECAVPMVLDADALNHVGTELERVKAACAAVIMTPHPGEAARLLGTTVADIEADRVAAVRRLALAASAVVVLKGPRTLVCCGLAGERQGRVAINPSGNPGLATAGSGDVLTGIIGGFLAQGMEPFDAACLGTYVHGCTGDRAAAALGGPHSVTAADLAEHIPAVLAELRALLP